MKERDLTSGSILKNIIYFSLPYLLAYFLQTLYGMADLWIVGQYNGVDSVTAVSIGSQAMHMLTVMIVGLAMGPTVIVGRLTGAGQTEDAADAVGNTIAFFMALSVIVTGLLLFMKEPIIRILSTPAEAAADTGDYLSICFLGIPFITAYNVISSVFRGMGDSKSPMYFIAVACGVNIVLDYLFIGAFHMGAAGAALATTLAQTVSVTAAAVLLIKKRKSGFTLARRHFRPRSAVMKNILRIGIPVMLQDGFIQISFMVITIIVNRRGLNDAAAVGIVEKLIGIFFLVPSTMLSAVSALSAHNIGAGKPERAAATLRSAIGIAAGFGLAVSVAMQFLGASAVGLFTDSPAVMELGGQYMRGYIWDCMFAGIHFCFSGYFCAYGYSGISFLHNFLSIICVRIPGAYLASAYFADTLFPMGLASTFGSVLSVVVCITAFFLIRRKEKIKNSDKK